MEDVFARAEAAGEDPFIVILDEISDPHNLGAIIRTTECAGAHGIVIPKRRAASLTQTAALSAAGAIENMPVVQVTNLARTIEELQAKGVWVGAADMDGETYYEANLTGPIAIVIGNEGKGVGRLVKEKCDFVLSIPMNGRINSLNASNAAAILMYGIRRARN
jgi:23S rRNA (guanosine2251-2'-O)-methyltransferase